MNYVKEDNESIDNSVKPNITNDNFEQRIEPKNQEQFNAVDNIEIKEPIQELGEVLNIEDTVIIEEKNNKKAKTIFGIFCYVIFCCLICFIVYFCMYINTIKNYDKNTKNNIENTKNNIENTTNNNENIKSAKDKLIDVLLKYGFQDYAGDKTFYYKKVILPPSCVVAESVSFKGKKYEVKMICYSNNTLAYDRTETYSWETYTLSSKIYEYNEYNGQLVRYINVTSDENLNLSCNIDDCDYFKDSLMNYGTYFASLLFEAGIEASDLD